MSSTTTRWSCEAAGRGRRGPAPRPSAAGAHLWPGPGRHPRRGAVEHGSPGCEASLCRDDIAAALLIDPANVRYASDPQPCRSGRCTLSTATSWCRPRGCRSAEFASRPGARAPDPGLETRHGDELGGLRLRADWAPAAPRSSLLTWPACLRDRGARSTNDRPRPPRRLRVPGPADGRGAPRPVQLPSSRRGRLKGSDGDLADPPVTGVCRRSPSPNLARALRPGDEKNEAWARLLGWASALGAKFAERRLSSSCCGRTPGPARPAMLGSSVATWWCLTPTSSVRGRLSGRPLLHLPRRLHGAVGTPAAAARSAEAPPTSWPSQPVAAFARSGSG